MSGRIEAARRAIATSGVLERVRALRAAGFKTEPALCEALGLDGGDPYARLLEIESWPEDLLRSALLEAIPRRVRAPLTGRLDRS